MGIAKLLTSVSTAAKSAFCKSTKDDGPKVDVHKSPAVASSSKESTDAPPAYEASTPFDPLSALSSYDTIFLVDDSSSMGNLVSNQNPQGLTLWHKACSTLIQYAELSSRYDADGIDVYFLNEVGLPVPNTNLTTRASIRALFYGVQPDGATPIGRRLREISHDYIKSIKTSKRGRRPKPRNYIIITDGEPTDPHELDGFLRSLSLYLGLHELPVNQIGFQFVQVGNDEDATTYLETLDNTCPRGGIDIIDTVKTCDIDPKASDALMTKILLGAVNRYHDEKRIPSAQRLAAVEAALKRFK